MPAMNPAIRRAGWIGAVLIGLYLLGSLRAGALWSHDPLYAYANSYDQTRYSSCLAIAPERAAGIAPEQNSPQAPYSGYRFQAAGEPLCYWSSELVFTAATALIWKAGEVLGGGPVHDVRWLGALRWLALLALSIALSRAWLKRGQVRAALANAALVPLLFADPGNTLYLNTFYAEFTALTLAWLVVALTLLWRDAPVRRWRFVLLTLAAFALAASKIQHLLLPLGLALAVLLLDALRSRRMPWRGLALGLGALCGLGLQVVQLQRSGLMMETIAQYNRADVVFTGLLPFADEPAALLAELGIDPACARYSGLRAWQMPDLPDRVCAGLANFTRGQELMVLASHPRLALGLFAHAVPGLQPWVAENLGQIEGGQFARITDLSSVGVLLRAAPWLQLALLALPLLGLIAWSWRPGWRRGSCGLDLCVLSVVTMSGTFLVTILGDGLADVAKQGHLVINAALAFLIVAAMAFARAGIKVH